MPMHMHPVVVVHGRIRISAVLTIAMTIVYHLSLQLLPSRNMTTGHNPGSS
jgi:hypothetical protein